MVSLATVLSRRLWIFSIIWSFFSFLFIPLIHGNHNHTDWNSLNLEDRMKLIEKLMQEDHNLQHRLNAHSLFDYLPFRNFDSFLNNESFAAIYSHCGPSQWGNKIAYYFEGAACADISGHHFYHEFVHEPEDKFYDGMQKVFLHPRPRPSGNTTAELFKRSCPLIYPWPFVHPGAWNQRPLLIRKLLNQGIDHAYPTAHTDYWDYNTFDVVNNRTVLHEKSLPAIPDAAIVFRCRDILHHGHAQPYGFVNFNFYSKVLPIDVQTIYILSEPLSYLRHSEEDAPAHICIHLVQEKIKFLENLYPNALIGVRRGYVYDSVLMLARAKTVICAPSTFCLWPGIANPNPVYFIPGNVIRFHPFLSESFYWVAYPPAIHLGDVRRNKTDIGSYVLLLDVLTAPLNESLIDYRNSYFESESIPLQS